MDKRTLTSGVQLAVRAAVAAGLALAVAELLGFEHPLYAFLAAVIVTDLAPAQSRQLGGQRVLATVVGASSGAALSALLAPGPVGVGLGVLAAMLLCQFAPARGGAKVAGYICGIVLLEHRTEPWTYASHRLLETLLGVVVATLVSYVPKLVRLDEPEDRTE